LSNKGGVKKGNTVVLSQHRRGRGGVVFNSHKVLRVMRERGEKKEGFLGQTSNLPGDGGSKKNTSGEEDVLNQRGERKGRLFCSRKGGKREKMITPSLARETL